MFFRGKYMENIVRTVNLNKQYKYKHALKDFNMAIQHNPNYAEAYYYRAAIKRDFKDDGFVDDYHRAIQLNPELKTLNDADVLMILKK